MGGSSGLGGSQCTVGTFPNFARFCHKHVFAKFFIFFWLCSWMCGNSITHNL